MLAALVVCSCAVALAAGGHTFYCAMREARPASARRMFGGSPAPLSAFGAACVLMDRYWSARCSCAVLAPRWALTAAHCVAPHVAYVKYNTQRPAAPDQGDVAPVHALYRHPEYRVVLVEEGGLSDVTLLQHDVGLVRTRRHMRLAAPPHLDPLASMKLYKPQDLQNEEVQVLGFGGTERDAVRGRLFSVRLRLVGCARATWRHCLCGAGAAAGAARGVCGGDSGGPVLARGAQVGVTSLGPLECVTGPPDATAPSVFTALYPYADMLNATVAGADAALRMRYVGEGAAPAERSAAARRRPPAPPALLALQLIALLL